MGMISAWELLPVFVRTMHTMVGSNMGASVVGTVFGRYDLHSANRLNKKIPRIEGDVGLYLHQTAGESMFDALKNVSQLALYEDYDKLKNEMEERK